MKEIFECSSCGIVTEKKKHLCQPVVLEGCGDFCGQPVGQAIESMCDEEKARFEFECGNCGRPSEQADLLCVPNRTH
jgi:hypothetical protein